MILDFQFIELRENIFFFCSYLVFSILLYKVVLIQVGNIIYIYNNIYKKLLEYINI